MIKIPVVDINNKEISQLELDSAVFGVELKKPLIHRVLQWHLTSVRTYTAHTKNRGDVSGGGKKPWKQKGTGRARAGDNRSPLWRHGGVIFGPRLRVVEDRLPLKVRHLAIKMILSELVKNKALLVLSDDAKLPDKTKNSLEILKKMGADQLRVLLIANPADKNSRGFRNLANVEILERPGVLRFEKYLKCEKIVTFAKALKEVEAQLLK